MISKESYEVVPDNAETLDSYNRDLTIICVSHVPFSFHPG